MAGAERRSQLLVLLALGSLLAQEIEAAQDEPFATDRLRAELHALNATLTAELEATKPQLTLVPQPPSVRDE